MLACAYCNFSTRVPVRKRTVGWRCRKGGSPHSLVGLVDVEDMGQVIGKMELAPGGKHREVSGRKGEEPLVFNLTGYYCMWNVRH